MGAFTTRTKTAMRRAMFVSPSVARILYGALYQWRAGWRRRAGYSQGGEDASISLHFGEHPPSRRLYVDIGANHPRLLSNTCKLYQEGWRGLTIEPIKQLADLHRRERPRDLCLNIGIGPEAGEAEFWETLPHVYSSFCEEDAMQFVRSGRALLIAKRVLPVQTLDEVLQSHPEFQEAVLLCVDTEGRDAAILEGISWEGFRPDLILVEKLSNSTTTPALAAQGYSCVQTFGTNTLFAKRRPGSGSWVPLPCRSQTE